MSESLDTWKALTGASVHPVRYEGSSGNKDTNKKGPANAEP